MKSKLNNITGAILYGILTVTGATLLGNKLLDFWQSLKVKTDLPEDNFIKQDIEKTVYPEEYGLDGFKEWKEYIFKERNKPQL